MSLLHKKPVFQLKIDVFGTTHYINVNGVMIIHDVGEDSQTSVVLPINHWMRSGENTIGFDIFPSEPGKQFNPNGYVRLDLIVHELSDPDKIYTIATLNFNGIKDANQSHTGGSSPSGSFSSLKRFDPDRSGDIQVYDVSSKPRPKADDFEGAMTFERKIHIQNSLPLWAFFNSEEMPDYTDLYYIDENKYDEAIMPLFSVYKKIYAALEKKEFESIFPMFEERNRETDLAFYREPGTTAARMREALQETINDMKDDNLEPVVLDLRSVNYQLEDNKKIVSLRKDELTHAISLNYKNKKKELGNERYPLFFRYQNGKYILTR